METTINYIRNALTENERNILKTIIVKTQDLKKTTFDYEQLRKFSNQLSYSTLDKIIFTGIIQKKTTSSGVKYKINLNDEIKTFFSN